MVLTFRDKFIKKYKLDKTASYNVKDIAKITGIKLKIIQQVYNRGVGAYKTNPTSVRSKDGDKRPSGYSVANRMTKEQWGYGRVFGFVMGNKKQVGKDKPDYDLFLLTKGS